ncbi:MAG: hypothetical protein IH627_12370 [Rubrivivax sp.]|nr:hypothetical protein [Rubrivivax sp.]
MSNSKIGMVIAIALPVLLMACGGGGGGDGVQTSQPLPANPAPVTQVEFRGMYTSTRSDGAAMVIVAIDNDGVEVWGKMYTDSPLISTGAVHPADLTFTQHASCCYGTDLPWGGRYDNSGITAYNIQSSTVFFERDLDFDLPLAPLSPGVYTSAGRPFPLTVDATGRIFGAISYACDYSGRQVVTGKKYNILKVTFTGSGCAGQRAVAEDDYEYTGLIFRLPDSSFYVTVVSPLKAPLLHGAFR